MKNRPDSKVAASQIALTHLAIPLDGVHLLGAATSIAISECVVCLQGRAFHQHQRQVNHLSLNRTRITPFEMTPVIPEDSPAAIAVG